jgi:hypothetical protein
LFRASASFSMTGGGRGCARLGPVSEPITRSSLELPG